MRALLLVLMWISAQVAAEAAQPAPAAYGSIEILSPQHEETLRDNGGDVTVRVRTRPRLRAGTGHHLRILLDGRLQGIASERTEIGLRNLDRGSHQIVAVIVDADGQELVRSAPVTVYLHRRSLLHPNVKSRMKPPDATSP
ncbi:MAG: hypothetical protein AB7O21_04240 [Gammaproteobacteria bacterium]